MKFEVIKKSKYSSARAGILHTNHGQIETPVFMPVGTQASVKSLTPEMLLDAGSQIILGNTYHLALRPGVEVIKEFGGLHNFMNWKKPILTDSGGFQVFSLSKNRKIHDNGVIFKSHLDGSAMEFTPKHVVDLQLGYNSDILMPLDICTPYPCDEIQAEKELGITLNWAKEAKNYWEKKHTGNMLFGIVQGGMHKHLREKSATALINIDFPGYSIGGVSVGEPSELMDELIRFTPHLLPENKPRYLMGVGKPENLSLAIDNGVDMFDCVIPTRLARHGSAFTSLGMISIKKQEFKTDKSVLDPNCTCYTCTNFSKAYLRHLFIAKELLINTLLSIHNVHFLVNYVKKIRRSILEEK